MKPKLTLIKIGGNVIDDPAALSLFLESFAALEGRKILVHGGGKLATQLAEQLGIPQQMIGGRRITDEDTLRIVTMVYAGYINKNIVAQLQARGCNALGLSGVDGNLLQAHKRVHTTLDYGFAGDVDQVNDSQAQLMLEMGLSLVVAPITHDKQGQLLNTNADTIAQELAQALSKTYTVQLVYCFEKNGVLKDVADEDSCIACIDKASFSALVAEKVIYEGMLPKLHNAFEALEKGVDTVTIGRWDRLLELIEGVSGTAIVKE